MSDTDRHSGPGISGRTSSTLHRHADGVAFRSQTTPDRVMRRVLRITEPRRGTLLGAHRALRWSIVYSGVRCVVTYLLLPTLGPVLSLAGWVTAPLGVGLCVVAAIAGVMSMRRFWLADHRHRWMYTGFIVFVFAVLALTLGMEIPRLAGS